MAEHLKIMNKRMVLLNPVSAFLNFNLTPVPCLEILVQTAGGRRHDPAA